MKRYWEIITDNLSKAGWAWGCVSAIDSNGRTIWIADAHRDDGKRFVMRADEKPLVKESGHAPTLPCLAYKQNGRPKKDDHSVL